MNSQFFIRDSRVEHENDTVFYRLPRCARNDGLLARNDGFLVIVGLDPTIYFCEFNSLSHSGILKYYICMMRRKIFFVAALFLLFSQGLFSFTNEAVEFAESWNAQKNEFLKTDVVACAGNEDNSLFLMATNQEDGGHSVVWIFHAGVNRDTKIRPLWDKTFTTGGTIKSLVYSPFSKKFYFTSAWADDQTSEKNTQGLYIASQTYEKKQPFVTLDHQLMEPGESHLLVNKKGVWLLKDLPGDDWSFSKSQFYQIEDEEGHFVFNVPEAADSISFNTFNKYGHQENKDLSIIGKALYEGVFQATDYTLLICDADKSSWWLYNCVNKKLTKYEDYWLARKNAFKYDSYYENSILYNLKPKTIARFIIQLITCICLVFSIIVIIILCIRQTKRIERKKAAVKEHNKMIFDIQEKERAKISRDIHDSVVQDIRVLRLETENLVVDEASKSRQTKIEDLATDCIIKLRNICYNLTPAELASHNEGDSTQLELISIINSLVQQFSARTHIPCVFKVEEGFEYPVLEKEKTQNLFRVIQEALTNIEKHSYATQASIFIKKADSSGGGKRALLIYITDDGIGCNQNELAKKLKSKEHLGLRGMKDRMELIGGQIEFFTAQNDGMEIKIELPLEIAK